jgi:hypothetical protein
MSKKHEQLLEVFSTQLESYFTEVSDLHSEKLRERESFKNTKISYEPMDKLLAPDQEGAVIITIGANLTPDTRYANHSHHYVLAKGKDLRTYNKTHGID